MQLPTLNLMTDLPQVPLAVNIAQPAVRTLHGYARKAVLLIAVLSLFRLFLAFGFELGNDEAYYWMYSRHLKPNYFDHPPMVALLIRLFTLNGLLQDAGWLRLGAVAGSALSSWFIYRAVSTLHSPRAGFYASGLYQASFYAALTAGVYIMPDSPQMIFWTAALWLLARIYSDERDWNNWLLFGLASGAAIMSKVHGAFLWTGLGAYIIFYRRSWLRLPQLYAAAGLTLLLISPILAWNIQNDFITYRFHSRRVTVDHFDMRFSYMIKEAIGQLLFNNPVNVLLIILGLWRWKQLPERARPLLPLFCWIALPHAGFLLLVSLFRDTTLPHWSGPAYVSLLPVAAIALAERHKGRFLPRVLLGALSLYVLTLLAWLLVVRFYPGTYGRREPEQLGTGDISLDVYGWKEAGQAFAGIYQQGITEGRIPAGTPVVASYWWGAHIEYYFCRPADIPFRAEGPVPDIREYHWRNSFYNDKPASGDAFCILASDEHYGLPQGYARSQPLYHIEILRSGKPAHTFTVYRLSR
jgi:hypothetical protein